MPESAPFDHNRSPYDHDSTPFDGLTGNERCSFYFESEREIALGGTALTI